MGIRLQRLLSCDVELPPHCYDGNKTWILKPDIIQKDPHFFSKLVENHNLLSVEYSVYCAQLVRDLHSGKTQAELNRQLIRVLIMAQLLEHIYRYYLNVHRELATLHREQNIYRALLGLPDQQSEDDTPAGGYIKTVREITIATNWFRLLALRLRRLFITVSPLLDKYEHYGRVINIIDKYALPALLHISWLFFAPRLVSNLFLLMKHLIPGSWMSEQEKSLSWSVRFRGQIQRRWFEFGNDGPWVAFGIVNCFVLTGALAMPVGIYVGFAMQVYDAALAIIRAYVELGRLSKLKERYNKLSNEPSSFAEKKQLASFLENLEKRMAYEKKRLYVQVINTTAIALAGSLALSLFAFNPMLAVIGAALSVLTTFTIYIAVKWIEGQKPEDKVKLEKLDDKAKLRFFQPPNTRRDDSVDGKNDFGRIGAPRSVGIVV